MPRSISIVRRRVGYVDLQVPKRSGKTGFRFSAASNFDSSFTNFQVVSNDGFRSVSLRQDVRGNLGNQSRDHVRFLFDPSDYTASIPAVRDDVPFFIRLEARNPDGSFDAPEGAHMVLPQLFGPQPPVLLHGDAPTGAGLTGSQEIQLPALCDDFEIRNQSTGSDLHVAFDRGSVNGTEFLVGPGQSLDQVRTTVYQIFVRGESGSATELFAILTLRNGPSDT